tara:strand:+ start:656 stop:775 length:120 start_codon:yes stop_codon:yes gene_type:complete
MMKEKPHSAVVSETYKLPRSAKLDSSIERAKYQIYLPKD